MPPRTQHSFLSDQQELRNQQVFAELELFSPSLTDAEWQRFEVPFIETRLLPTLHSHRLVVFGGRRVPEKNQFGKHLAWHWLKSLEAEGDAGEVKQWHPKSGFVDIPAVLSRCPEKTLFLFPDLHPRNLAGYDLTRLLDDLASHSQFAILTTDEAATRWSPAAQGLERSVWCDAAAIRFPEAFLTDSLISRLHEYREQLPPEIGRRTSTLDGESPLTGSLRLRSVARGLGTPIQIRAFVVALTQTRRLSEEVVRENLNRALDVRHSVQQWYHHLDPRHQVLALGLLLLDGLLDDQTFAALETLVRGIWRDWDPDLHHFDYHELGRVAAYFQGTEAQDSGRVWRIESLSPETRDALFETCWREHRRRILASLPALVRLIHDSPDIRISPGPERAPASELPSEEPNEETETESPGLEDSGPEEQPTPSWSHEAAGASRWYRQGRRRDLFGSRQRTVLLHHCIAGTLSEIGRLSTDAIEPILLDLAQDRRQSVQAVAAEALAKWRELGPGDPGDHRLFRVLSAWQNESFLKELSQLRRRKHAAAKPFAHVRATLALTVSRAALYDRPNELDGRLLKLFEKLVDDPSPIVRSRLRSDTLPSLVAGHLRQLEGILWKAVLPQEDLLVGTAFGFAQAHTQRPAEAGTILQAWHRRAMALDAAHLDPEIVRHRAHGLATVAMIYGLMIEKADSESSRVQEIFHYLHGLLEREDHPLIRTAVFSALVSQGRSGLEAVAPFVKALLGVLLPRERSVVAGFFTDLYLEQRRSLETTSSARAPEPDAYVSVAGVHYPTWVETERPLTTVEKILHGWLDDASKPVAIQVALECLESFSATTLDGKERRILEQAREDATEDAEEDQEYSVHQESRRKKSPIRRLPWSGQVAVVIAAPLSSSRRRVLRAALPELLASVRRTRSPKPSLLRHLWGRGNPNRKRMTTREAFKELFGTADLEEVPMIRRLNSAPRETSRLLARKLTLAYRLFCWRWPLITAFLTILAATAVFAVLGPKL